MSPRNTPPVCLAPPFGSECKGRGGREETEELPEVEEGDAIKVIDLDDVTEGQEEDRDDDQPFPEDNSIMT